MLARQIGLIPKIGLLAMLTAPCGGAGSVATLADSDTVSPRRLGSDRSTLSEVNHRPESRMRNVAKSKMWPGAFKPLALNTAPLDYAT